jgi:hypothetical protein
VIVDLPVEGSVLAHGLGMRTAMAGRADHRWHSGRRL